MEQAPVDFLKQERQLKMKGAESTHRSEDGNHSGHFVWYERMQCTPFVTNIALNIKGFINGT